MLNTFEAPAIIELAPIVTLSLILTSPANVTFFLRLTDPDNPTLPAKIHKSSMTQLCPMCT